MKHLLPAFLLAAAACGGAPETAKTPGGGSGSSGPAKPAAAGDVAFEVPTIDIKGMVFDPEALERPGMMLSPPKKKTTIEKLRDIVAKTKDTETRQALAIGLATMLYEKSKDDKPNADKELAEARQTLRDAVAAAGDKVDDLTLKFDGWKLGGAAKYSTESDYTSLYLGLHGDLELAQKNAVLAAGGGVSLDSVSTTMAGGLGGIKLQCDPHKLDAGHDSCSLHAYSGSVSFSQILSRDAVAAVTYDVAAMRGYQSNPYRSVITAAQIIAERHPDTRLRQAIAGSLRYYVTATETTLVAAYRYYRDDWHVRAHTPEIRILQQVGPFSDAGFRFRYYTQSKASFYEDRYLDNSSAYISDDP